MKQDLVQSVTWHSSLLLMAILANFIDGSRSGKSTKDAGGDTEIRPIFKPTNRNITVGPGDRAVLKCRVENLGTKTVTFRKEDDAHPLTIGMFPFAPDTRVTVDYNQRTMEWMLIIQDVKPTDEGIYRCQISTKNDKHSYDIRLNVKTIQVSGTQYIEKGSSIQLVCNVTGKPDPPNSIDWYRGNNRVNSDTHNGIIITKKIETRVMVSMLVIKNSQPEDSGEYVCRSSDRESSSIKVHVLNVPNSSGDKHNIASVTSRSIYYGGTRSVAPHSTNQERNVLNLATTFAVFALFSNSR